MPPVGCAHCAHSSPSTAPRLTPHCVVLSCVGSCRFGDKCRFSHGADHPGTTRTRTALRSVAAGLGPACGSSRLTATRTTQCGGAQECCITLLCSYDPRLTLFPSLCCACVLGVAREPRAPRAPRGEKRESAPRDNSCYSFAQSGSCKFGDQCRFTHGDNKSGAASGASRPRGRRPLASKSQLCFSFSESQTCQYGDACRFAHGENDNRDLNMLKRRTWNTPHTPCHAHTAPHALQSFADDNSRATQVARLLQKMSKS